MAIRYSDTYYMAYFQIPELAEWEMDILAPLETEFPIISDIIYVFDYVTDTMPSGERKSLLNVTISEFIDKCIPWLLEECAPIKSFYEYGLYCIEHGRNPETEMGKRAVLFAGRWVKYKHEQH